MEASTRLLLCCCFVECQPDGQPRAYAVTDPCLCLRLSRRNCVIIAWQLHGACKALHKHAGVLSTFSKAQAASICRYHVGTESLLRHFDRSVAAADSFLVMNLQENVGAFDIDLSDDVVSDINKIYARFRDPSTKPLDD